MEPGGMFDPLVAFRLNETAVAAMNGLISRLRARWPHIELPGRVGKSPRDPGPPTCLRCQIEDEIGLPYCDGLGPPRPAETYSANLGMLLNDQVAALRKRVEELEQDIRIHDTRRWLSSCTPAERSEVAFYADVEGFKTRAEKAERERTAALESLASYQAASHNYVRCYELNRQLQADLDAALAERDKHASRAVEMDLLWSGTNCELEEAELDIEALALVAGGDPWPQRPGHQEAWERIRNRGLLEKRREENR